MTFTPTPEQSAVIDAVTSTRGNLMVGSLAGSAKTTTLVMTAEAQPKEDILSLAFNKRIEVEMTKRLPGNAIARTINGLCHRAWGDTIGKRLQVDTSKVYKLLKAEVDGLPSIERSMAYKDFSETMEMVSTGKTSGWVPDGHFPEAKRLLNDEDFFNSLDTMPSEQQIGLIRRVSIRSIRQGMDGVVDFDDQVLLAAVFSTLFPRPSLVLVDEAQDLSELNHVILKKVAKKRLIGFGDEFQSIYAFRGAHQQSMGLMQEQFNMRRLALSVSFRCPQAVVKEAWWRAPLMRWPEWATEGAVNRMDQWSTEHIPDQSAILCRNNAPLFSMAIRFMKAGRNVKLIGNDIGKGLLKIMRKFGTFDLSQGLVMVNIDNWVAEQKKKTRTPAKLHDRANCMRLFAEQGRTLGEACAYAEHLFAQDGPVQLMTGHKSKGLEYDNVFLLDRGLIRTEVHDQEKNLLYVCQTRAKQSLTYITSEGFGA